MFSKCECYKVSLFMDVRIGYNMMTEDCFVLKRSFGFISIDAIISPFKTCDQDMPLLLKPDRLEKPTQIMLDIAV